MGAVSEMLTIEELSQFRNRHEPDTAIAVRNVNRDGISGREVEVLLESITNHETEGCVQLMGRTLWQSADRLGKLLGV